MFLLWLCPRPKRKINLPFRTAERSSCLTVVLELREESSCFHQHGRDVGVAFIECSPVMLQLAPGYNLKSIKLKAEKPQTESILPSR